MSDIFYNAATLLSEIDSHFEQGTISNDSRKMLLDDLSTILDRFNEGKSDENLRIEQEEEVLSISNSRYERTYYAPPNTLRIEHFYNSSGELHRDDNKPARIAYTTKGNIISEEWFQEDVLVRADGKPAMVFYNENSTVSIEQWFENNLHDREDDKPSLIMYNNEGTAKVLEQWHSEGRRHRDDDKPAHISYSSDGRVSKEIWYHNGINQRLNGKPSTVTR